MENQHRNDKTKQAAVNESIHIYEKYLYERERHPNTVKKYLHDVRKFFQFVHIYKEENKEGARITEGSGNAEAPGNTEGPRNAKAPRNTEGSGNAKEPGSQGEPESPQKWENPIVQDVKREWVLHYKEYLMEHYKATSTNSMLAALNGYLKFIGREDCCVQLCRVQRQIFREEERELTQEEYRRLILQTERGGNSRMGCILQTIGSTGIRVSELSYITVEALEKMMVSIRSKGKERCIVLPRSLVEMLKKYCRQKKIEAGSVFVTRRGKPVDRRNIWAEMKKLCRGAGILEKKGFPHNLRHLFARTYYEKEKDIVRLADYLGHSNVETTRRYTMVSSMQACLRQLELGMLVEGYLDRKRERKISEVHPWEKGGRKRWRR